MMASKMHEDNALLGRESSPARRVRFLKERVNEMRYAEYSGKVAMLNKVKEYIREHWRGMGEGKKKRLIKLVRRMEREVD